MGKLHFRNFYNRLKESIPKIIEDLPFSRNTLSIYIFLRI